MLTHPRSGALTIAAGDSLLVDIAGNFFRVLAASGALLVAFDDDDQSAQVEPGLAIYRDNSYSKFRLINDGAAPVTGILVAVGFGRFDDNRLQYSGVVDVTGSAVTVSGGVAVSNLPATYPDGLTKGERQGWAELGASWATASAAGIATLIDPAANINGVHVRRLTLVGRGNTAAVFADTAAPAAWNDATKRSLGDATSEIITVVGLYLPPGVGLFHAASGAAASSYVQFDLL